MKKLIYFNLPKFDGLPNLDGYFGDGNSKDPTELDTGQPVKENLFKETRKGLESLIPDTIEFTLPNDIILDLPDSLSLIVAERLNLPMPLLDAQLRIPRNVSIKIPRDVFPDMPRMPTSPADVLTVFNEVLVAPREFDIPVPAGTQIITSLGTFTIDEEITVTLPAGLSIDTSNAGFGLGGYNIPLPESQVTLPAGTKFTVFGREVASPVAIPIQMPSEITIPYPF